MDRPPPSPRYLGRWSAAHLSRLQIRLAGLVIAALASLLPIASPAQTETVGVLPGTFNVGDDGAASYSIPIAVAEGIRGLTPSISLAYSSNAGSGWAGVGWNLSGFRAVTRCHRNLSTDSSIWGVRFAQVAYFFNDRFCLDGQPLMQTGSGVYGGANTEYRKEINDYTKVVSNGSTGTTGQPVSFTATDRDGVTYSFGGTDDSQIDTGLASGAIRLWAIDTITDRFGNKVRFKYGQPTDGSGEYWPSEVLWTVRGTDDATARYRLQFNYETRPAADIRDGWIFGARWTMGRRLTTITYDYRSGGGWQNVHTYTLRYRAPVAGGSGRSQLEGVELCSPAQCYPETTFGWHDGVTVFTAPAEVIPAAQYSDPALYNRFVDFDGDGDQDLFTGNGLYVVSNGTFAPAVTPRTTTNGLVGTQTPFEFDGDGKTDFFYVLATQTQPGVVYRSTGDPSGYELIVDGVGDRPLPAMTANSYFPVPFPFVPMDLNGDGCDELVYIDEPSPTVGRVMVHKNPCNGSPLWPAAPAAAVTGAITTNPELLEMGGQATTLHKVDFDGDGRSDLLVRTGFVTWEAYLSVTPASGVGTFEYIGQISPASGGEPLVIVGDVNGDGMSDVVVQNFTPGAFGGGSGLGYLYISKGNGFELTHTFAYGNHGRQRLADVDGDGRDDLIDSFLGGGYGNWFLRLSTGTAFESTGLSIGVGTTIGRGSTCVVPKPPEPSLELVDLNADGQKDLIGTWIPSANCAQPINQIWKASLKPGPRPDLMTSVDNPMGVDFAVTYKALGVAANEANPSYTVTATPTPPTTRVVRNGQHVVTTYDRSDGVGGTTTLSYTYRNGLRNTRGRGWLGFDQIAETDSRAKSPDIVTTYLQTWPLSGRVQQRDTKKKGTSTLLQRYVATYVTHASAPWVFPHLYEEVSTDYDLAGNAVRVTRHNLHGTGAGTGWNYTHGAPTVDETEIGPSGAAQSGLWTTTLAYTYDAAPVVNNCLGMPTRVDDTREGPHEAASTRTTQYHNLSQSCVPDIITVGATSSPNEQLVSNLYYDNFGNVDEQFTHGGAGIAAQPRRTFFVFGSETGTVGQGYRLTRLSRRQSEELSSACTGVTPAVDLHTDYTWDPRFGLETSVLVPSGDRTDQSYDGLGRPTVLNPSAQSASDTAITNTQYLSCASGCGFTSHGQFRVVTSEATGPGQTAVSTAVVDRLGRTVGTTSTLVTGAISQQATTYNALGQVVTETVPFTGASAPGSRTMTYDDLGRLEAIVEPVTVNGSAVTATTAFSYSGFATTETDPDQQPTQRAYFANGLLASVTDAKNGLTAYEYNGFGEMTRINYVGGWSRTYGYNSRGFMTSRSDPNSGSWSFGYTPYGEQSASYDGRGNLVSTGYDMLGRILGRYDNYCTAPGACGTPELTTEFGYKGTGELARVRTGSFFDEYYNYSDRGKLTSIETIAYGTLYRTDIQYDTYGRVQDKTYPEIPSMGRYVYRTTYNYGQLKSVRESVGFVGGFQDVYTVVEMNAAGQVTKGAFGPSGGSVIEEHSRDDRAFRLTAIKTGTTTDLTAYQDLAYSWNVDGTLDWRKDLKQGGGAGLLEEFEYDELDRLTQVKLAGQVTQSLTYQASGNIGTKSDVGTYYYGQDGAFPHAVTSVTGAPNRLYHYNANGQMDCRGAQTSACTGGNKLEWFIGGGVREVNNGAVKSVFAYGGADRRRVSQTITNANVPTSAQNRTLTYVGPHFQIEAEQYTGKVTYRLSVFAEGRAVYQRKEVFQNGTPVAGGPQAHYLHRDHLGSVVKLTPAIATPSPGEKAYSFDAFGGRRGTNWQANSGAYGQDHWTDRGYTGHEHLDDVELIHMNGRVQHPGLGRFLSPDAWQGNPAMPQTLNPYSYVSNNPLSATDPSGYCEAPADSDGGNCVETIEVTAKLKEKEPEKVPAPSSGTSVGPAGPAAGGGNFTTPNPAAQASQPEAAQKQDDGGGGLTKSEQEALKDYLDAYKRSLGGSGGVLFFGSRRTMALLNKTGGARALLADRRAGLNLSGSAAASLVGLSGPVLAGPEDVADAIRLAFAEASNQKWLQRINAALSQEQAKYVGVSGDAWASVIVRGFYLSKMDGMILHRGVPSIQGFEISSTLYRAGQPPYSMLIPKPPFPQFVHGENVQLTADGNRLDVGMR